MFAKCARENSVSKNTFALVARVEVYFHRAPEIFPSEGVVYEGQGGEWVQSNLKTIIFHKRFKWMMF